MRNLYYTARVGVICIILAFITVHAAKINAAFVRWLDSPPPSLLVQCYSMPKGQR